MFIKLFLGAILLFANASCENISHSSQAFLVYNQAYQENYSADSIEEILEDAKNAYVLVDPFVNNIDQYISAIKLNNNEVAGYISVGTGEDWRSDFSSLQPFLTTIVWSEWAGEYYVSQTTTGILDVMKRRIDTMAYWGLDWVEFDNMDWLDEETKLTYNLVATKEEAKFYVNALCDYAHSKNMKCMAKNTVDGFENFDGVLYESYDNEKNWWDTQGTRDFLSAGKPVIINHYNEIDCDGVYTGYKQYYHSDAISFICEDKITKKYKHYNQNNTDINSMIVVLLYTILF